MRNTFLFSLFALTSIQLMAQAEEIQDACGNAPAPRRAAVRHIESKGIGYNQGYTSVDLFVASNRPMQNLVPFFDGRLHIFNDGKPALNAGLGLRYLSSSWVYGVNSYYDYRKTSHFHYNQVALGLEALGKRFDFRWNGYLPVGKKKSALYNTQFSHFQEHSAFLKSRQEFAMRGMNLEAGCHLKKMKHASFYAAAGPYYFYNEGKNAIGGEMRVSATIYDYLKLEVNGSYDPIFKGIGQGQISLILPFGPKTPVRKDSNRTCTNQIIVRERALQPVDRSEIIVVDHNRKITKAIDPATGVPYNFFFVNNKSSSAGTFESPYPTLAQAQTASSPGDIIYVFEGNGNGYDVGTGFYMQNNQKLWGSGTTQQLQTTLGMIPIANQTGGMPTLTGNGIAEFGLVNVTHNNEVSGMHITGDGTAYYGILGGDGSGYEATHAALSISNALIQNNRIDGAYAQSGMRLASFGAVVVAQNQIDCSVGADFAGIELYSLGSQNLTALIANNTISADATGNGSVYGIICASLESSTLTSLVNSNTISGNSLDGGDVTGTDFYSSGTSSFNSTFNDNTISASSTGDGQIIGVNFASNDDSSLNTTSHSNTIFASSSGAGFVYGVYSESGNRSGFTSTVNSNTIFASSTGTQDVFGVFSESTNDSTFSAIIDSNTISANAIGGGEVYGMSSECFNDSVFSAIFNSNTISASAPGGGDVYGAVLQADGNSVCSAIFNSNTISASAPGGGDLYGVYSGSFGDSTLSSSITNQLLIIRGSSSSNDAYGIYATGPSTSGSADNNTGTVGGAIANTPIDLTDSTMTQSSNTIVAVP